MINAHKCICEETMMTMATWRARGSGHTYSEQPVEHGPRCIWNYISRALASKTLVFSPTLTLFHRHRRMDERAHTGHNLFDTFRLFHFIYIVIIKMTNTFITASQLESSPSFEHCCCGRCCCYRRHITAIRCWRMQRDLKQFCITHSDIHTNPHFIDCRFSKNC